MKEDDIPARPTNRLGEIEISFASRIAVEQHDRWMRPRALSFIDGRVHSVAVDFEDRLDEDGRMGGIEFGRILDDGIESASTGTAAGACHMQ